jgi:hypothetical protein
MDNLLVKYRKSFVSEKQSASDSYEKTKFLNWYFHLTFQAMSGGTSMANAKSLVCIRKVEGRETSDI